MSLHGEGYFGHEIEHLAVLLQCVGYEVNVYLGFSRRGDAMEQHHIAAEMLQQDLVVGFLLRRRERLDALGMGRLAVIEPTDFALVELEKSAVFERLDNVRTDGCLVLQFLATDIDKLRLLRSVDVAPMGDGKKRIESVEPAGGQA